MKKMMAIISLLTLSTMANALTIEGQTASNLFNSMETEIVMDGDFDIKANESMECVKNIATEEAICEVVTAEAKCKTVIRAGRRVKKCNNSTSGGKVEYTYRAGHRVVVNPNKPSSEKKCERVRRGGHTITKCDNETSGERVEYTYRAGHRVIKR